MNKHAYLSGETIGICVGGRAWRVLVGRLVGGFGLSGLPSVVGSVIVWSGLEVTLRFSANRLNGKGVGLFFNVAEYYFPSKML